MTNPVETILTGAGIPPEDVAKIVTPPEGEEFDPKPYIDKIRTNYETQLKNDPKFFDGVTLETLPPAVKKALESGQFARASNIVKGKVAKLLGFSNEEIADLEADEFKGLEHWTPAVLERYQKLKVAGNDKELQKQLIEARKKAEQYEGIEERLKTQYETESSQKINNVVFNSHVVSELATVPNLKINAADISKTAADILQGKYGFEVLDGYSGIELRQKSNPQMKVLKEGSSQEFTLRDAVRELAIQRGWADPEPVATKGKGTVTNVEPSKGGGLKMVAPHIADRIKSKIDADANR